MATFQLFFQSGRAKDLSAPLYNTPNTQQPSSYKHNNLVSTFSLVVIITRWWQQETCRDV